MMNDLIKYWPVAVFILNGLTVWACWSLRQLAKQEISAAVSKLQDKDDAISVAVDSIDTRTTRLEGRIEHLEDEIDNLPTKADLARVEGGVAAVAQTVEAVKGGVIRIEGFFLAKGVERA